MISAYAPVVAGIVGLTLLSIAGPQRYERRLAADTPYLLVVSAAALVSSGVGFLFGLF